MYIVQISCEFAPIAKVGGLGDVVSGLSHALVEQGHEVEVILPKYDTLDLEPLSKLELVLDDLESYYDQGWITNNIWSAYYEDVKLLLIDPENLTNYFKRGSIYGTCDDVERFTYYSRAALEMLVKTKRQPDIIHLHDWQTAAAAPLFKDLFTSLGLSKSKIVFTSHNLAYQGQCEAINLDRIGLASENYLSMDTLLDNEYASIANLTKGGIVYSDYMTTVSPTYAIEVRSEEGGHRLREALVDKGDCFKGILNGIDYKYWNPKTDTYLHKNFDKQTLRAKPENKRALQKELGLAQEDKPIVSCITRLVPQKCPHLIRTALYRCIEKGAQFILLGSSPIADINEKFYRIRDDLAEHKDVFIEMEYNEGLAHRVYAASDMFIVPSLFEPCGLTPLIAMRYGTVPIVRSTGGLADTVFDLEYSGAAHNEINGFNFNDPDDQGICSALDRAIETWYSDKKTWQTLVENGMSKDFSWQSASQHYTEVYKQLTK